MKTISNPQTSSKTVTATGTQIGKPAKEESTNGFANLLTKSISSGVEVGESKHKAPVDLTSLGEIIEDEKQVKKFDLSDLLADVSHKTEAPKGTEIINLKTVLGSKNDDPELISKEILELVPLKDKKQAMSLLIKGAKKVLTEELNNRIPKSRIPKTLKGLVEMAVRFNLEVKEVKLEKLGDHKIVKDLLIAVEKNTPQPKQKPVGAQVMLNAFNADKQTPKDLKKIETTSPLETLLAKNSDKVEKEILETPLLSDKKIAPLATQKIDKKAIKDDKIVQKDEKNDLKTETLLKDEKLAKNEEVAKMADPMQQKNKLSPLQQMLAKNEEKDEESLQVQSKQEVLNTQASKNDIGMKENQNLGLKIAEARQLTSQLSNEIKEAMQNYKPPFTKLNMKLNPERLGEIDVVMVQRGNNVHINLSSNTQALGILQQNSQELRTALNNAGLSDSTMNFSSNGENRNQQQQKHSTGEVYEQMAKLHDDIDTLEIVVPSYA